MIKLELFPKSGPALKISQIKNKEPRVNKIRIPKSVHKKHLKKLDELFFFNIVGLSHIFESKKSIEKVFKLIQFGAVIEVRHEPRNKFDKFACGVYLNNLKLGYIPKDKNRDFLDRIKLGEKFVFYIYNTSPFENNFYFNGPGVVGIRV